MFPSLWNLSSASVRCLPLISPSIRVKVIDSDFSMLSIRSRVVVQYENTTLHFWINIVSLGGAVRGGWTYLFSPTSQLLKLLSNARSFVGISLGSILILARFDFGGGLLPLRKMSKVRQLGEWGHEKISSVCPLTHFPQSRKRHSHKRCFNPHVEDERSGL